MAAQREIAHQFGIEWTDADGLRLVGNPLYATAETLISRGVRLQQDEVVSMMLTHVSAKAREHMPWLSDARALLDAVVAAGVPCALVTMSMGSLVEAFISEAGDVFATVVTGDQVSRGKPDPEAYLLAAQRLRVDARQCVAIEDSPAGARSAHASGAVTIAVKRHVMLPSLPGMSRLHSLDGIDLEGVSRFFAGHVQDDLAAG